MKILLKRKYFKTGLFCQKPGGSHVAELWLDVATVDLNSRLHIQGLHCEIWRKYNQFTHEQAPVSDMQHIIAKHTNRQRMPWLIEAFGSYKLEVVYMKSDWYASQACTRCIIACINREWCFIKKFTGSQLHYIVQNQIIWVLWCIRNFIPVESLLVSHAYDEGDLGSTLASLLC